MSQQREKRIVEGELLSEPHIKGRRISVLTIRDQVEGRGLEAETVADRLDLDLADVYSALLYYHEHPDVFAALTDERRRIAEDEDLSKYPVDVDGS